MRLTKRYVERLEPPTEKGAAYHYDDALKGFGVRVTAGGVKSFIVETALNGRQRRRTLGRYPAFTVEQARKEAQDVLRDMSKGKDTVMERRNPGKGGRTLREAFAAFLAERDLKPRSRYDYGRVMAVALPDWQHRPLSDISRVMVSDRFRKLTEHHGKEYANLSMRVLRAVYNFARAEDRDLPENPVLVLRDKRIWHRSQRRNRVVRPYQLRAWWSAVVSLEGEMGTTVRDYLVLLLLTGLRRQEAAKLTWEQVDLDGKVLVVTDTKNRDRHELPLSDHLAALLSRRLESASSEFVFPGPSGQGPLVEPRNHIQKVIERSGVEFTIHDLRRTFLTVAESLDISAYAVKRLANHRAGSDVTQGYIRMDVERLRRPMQAITDYVLREAGIRSGATVAALNSGAAGAAALAGS